MHSSTLSTRSFDEKPTNMKDDNDASKETEKTKGPNALLKSRSLGKTTKENPTKKVTTNRISTTQCEIFWPKKLVK